MSSTSQWEKTWAKVIKDPLDFSSWEALVKLAEGVKSFQDQDKQNLRTVYDHFLQKFPLLFGYWKKYADWETQMAGIEAAIAVYERGVASVHNSVDLWVFYLSYKMEKAFKSPEETRELFERAAIAVGLDFLSHPFWDKYIEFEQGQMNSENVFEILERVIQIPLHQYARYYQKYSELMASVPTRELVTDQELELLTDKVRNENTELSQEEVDNQVRQQIFVQKADIHAKTKKGVQERWTFESMVKRSYFHIKPLDDAQKSNWTKYLDWEEEHGDLARIYALYERCLVPCAQYEEFWYRYAMYLQSKGDMDRAYNVLVRATSLFVHPSRAKIRLVYSSFLEELGQVDEARNVFTTFLKGNSGHMEMRIKHAYFELRQGQDDVAIEILSDAADSASEEESGMYLAHRIKLLFKKSGDKEEARNLFQESFEKVPESKFIWIHAFIFELQHPDESTATRLQSIWESAYASALAPEPKISLARRYGDYMLENGYPAAHLNRLEIQISYLARYIVPSEPSKKRSSLAANGTHKVPRVE